MKIFIDFDDVLFCTRDFKKSFKNSFLSVGVSSEDFEESYQAARKNDERGFDNYDYDKHIKILSERGLVDKTVLSDSVEDFLVGAEKYVFSDVINFLEKVKNGGHELFLISFGSDSFQRKKVENSGLGKYFSDIKVGNLNKAVEIEKIIGGDVDGEMWFIDDRVEQVEMVKRAFSEMKTILLKRADGRYFDEVNEFCDFEAKDLRRVEQILSV